MTNSKDYSEYALLEQPAIAILKHVRIGFKEPLEELKEAPA